MVSSSNQFFFSPEIQVVYQSFPQKVIAIDDDRIHMYFLFIYSVTYHQINVFFLNLFYILYMLYV